MGAVYGQGPWNPGVYSQGNLWALSGNLAPSISFIASTSNPNNLSGGNLPAIVSFSGSTLNGVIGVAGGIVPIVNLSGSMSGFIAVKGGIYTSASFSADMNIEYAENAGNIPVAPVFLATSMESGSLWQPDDAECPIPVWMPEVPCEG